MRVAPLVALVFACSLIIDEDYVFVSADGGVGASTVTGRAEPTADASAPGSTDARDAALAPARDRDAGDPPECAAGVDTPGDCRILRCSEQGLLEQVVDDRDEPADPGGGCSRPACSGGAVVQVPREEGIRCGADATECSDVDRCDGQGNCLTNHRAGQVLRAATAQDCRTRVCDETGVAVEVPTAAACDDGSYCTGAETCTNEGACTSSGDPCPSGDAICANACDESAGACTGNDPRGASCGGASRCDGAGACRACLGSEDCAEPAPVCSGDGRCVECVADSGCQGRVALGECRRAACVGGACTTAIDVGARCGSSADTECDNPDSCAPSGECQPNYEGGGACGEPGRGCSCDNAGPTCRC